MQGFTKLITTEEFWKIVISNIFAFSFAILLFFLSQYLKNYLTKKNYLKNLKHEIDFNLRLLKKYSDNFAEWLLLIHGKKNGFFEPFDFSKFLNNFFLKCLTEGLLYKKLTSKEISILMGIQSFFIKENQDWINNFLKDNTEKTKSGTKINKKMLISFYNYQKNRIDNYYNLLESFKKKL
jgi:hypothetical protein